MMGETSCIEEGKQERPQDCVNGSGEGSVEAANHVMDEKMQELPQEVPRVINSEFSPKSFGDASGGQNIETSCQDQTVETIQGKDYHVGLEETSNITLKHVVHEQFAKQKETDVSASVSHPAKLNQTYESVNHDAQQISIENDLSSLNKEEVSFGGIEIHPEDRTNVLVTQQLEIPVEVISSHEQQEGQSKNPKKNISRSGGSRKRTSKVTKKKYTLRSSLSTDRALRSRSLNSLTEMDLENEKANATTADVKRRGRKKKSEKEVVSNEYSRIRKNLSYMLNRIRYEQSLIDAYSSEGWKGLSLDKLKPDKEIERAKSEIVRRKLKIRDLFQHLDSLCAEGKLPEDLFDSEGLIDSEDIFCAKCGSKDLTLDNDIILCDGICERGFHQFCLEPPLPKEDIPPDNEGWLCPGCDCKVDCTDLLNELQGMKLSMHDSWEKVFPEAVKAGNLDPNSGHSTDDSEDDDYDPEKPRNDEEGDESSSGGSEYATASDKSDGGPNKDNKQDLGLPSDDSEDDDFDPDGQDPDKAKEGSSASDFTSDSEDLAATLVDKGSVGGKKEKNLNDEMSESDTGESGASPITVKRHVPRLDYKKLHDEEYGGTSSGSSDDEEWTDTVETRKRKQQQMDKPEVSVKRTRNGQNSPRKNVSAADSQCNNDSPKSNSAGAKGQSSNPRRVLGKEEKQRLQDAFNTNHFPDRATKESLAQELGITFQQVDKWFGNARWFFNHPSGRKINVSGKAAAKSNPVPETTTVGNDGNAAAASNGDQSAAKPESSSVPGKKLVESPKSNNKAITPVKKKKKKKKSKNNTSSSSSASKTPQGQSSSNSRTRSRRRQSGT